LIQRHAPAEISRVYDEAFNSTGSQAEEVCAMVGITITTQVDLPGADGDQPYTLFVNQTEYGNARFLRTNVLSARPDPKKYTALRFRQDVKRHAYENGSGEDVVLVFMEALELEPPLTLPLAQACKRLPIICLSLLICFRRKPSNGELGFDEGGHGAWNGGLI
jgi:hypothetical protein